MKTTHISRNQIIVSSHKFRVPCISYNAIINAAIINKAVTSKMKTVTGRGPDKMSLVKGYTPLLSEEVD